MADNTDKLDAAVKNLKARGVVLPQSPARAKLEAGNLHRMASEGMAQRHADFAAAAKEGTAGTLEHVEQLEAQNALMRSMGANRSLRKKASGSDVYAAIPRMYDPLEYFDMSGLPWNIADDGHRKKLHKWMRLYYATHYLVPILIDIFTRFPLVGMELKSPDPQLNRFYEDLFFDQLNYGDFLVSMGREVWTVGEAFPFGSFNEDLGIWEREELLNPEDVTIDNYPMLGEKELRIVPPEYLKKLANTKMPAKEYRMLEINFPEIIPYLRKDKKIPISGVLLKQVANKQTDWDDHGTPILLRGLKTLIHEEKLNASQDGVAERLYSPLILAKLGIMDLGDGQGPWIPTGDELEQVRDDMDTALSSDFRLLVHHFGLDIENVFGREQMPRLGDDFDRIERRLMQIFGVNPSLLSAGSNSQPYASSALQAEFLNQILRTFQGRLKEHFRQRALVVAEAHEHYAYEKRGDTRVPIMEEVMVTDPETGEMYKDKRHKLMVPKLDFSCLAYGSRVSTPRGPVATEDLVEGDSVIAWDLEADAPVESKVSHSYDNGRQETRVINTRLGRRIEATLEHPFLTKRGWIEAGNLVEGDEVRIGTDVPALRIPEITERDARFLGLIVGDGCVSCDDKGAVPSLANIDQEILSWTDHYVSGYGCSLKTTDGVTHRISQNDQRVNPNPIKAFLKRHGISGKDSHTKRVPEEVWSGGPGVWAAFLSGYLDADGTTKIDKEVSWSSCNEDLLKDCQDLLAFLGVRATLYSFGPQPEESLGSSDRYRLVIASKEGLNTAQKILDPLCFRKRRMSTKTFAVDERRSLSPVQAMIVKREAAQKRNRYDGPTYREIGESFGVSSSTVMRAVKGEYDDLIASHVSPKWDKIASIDTGYEVPTWSLGIEETHTHVTEGLVTHNTFDLRDEATERQFLQQMRTMGVPIPDSKMMIGVEEDISDLADEFAEEIVTKTVAQQEAKMKAYKIMQNRGIPIPPELKAEVESVLGGTETAPPPEDGGGMGGPPPGGAHPPAGGPGPTAMPGGIAMPPPPPGLGLPGAMGPGGPGHQVGPPPIAPNGPGAPGNGTVPPASVERRTGMPKPASSVEILNDPNPKNASVEAVTIADTEPETELNEIETDISSDTVSNLSTSPLIETDHSDEDEIVERPIEAKVKKSYSFIEDPDEHPIEKVNDETNDKQSESSGSVSERDRGASS